VKLCEIVWNHFYRAALGANSDMAVYGTALTARTALTVCYRIALTVCYRIALTACYRIALTACYRIALIVWTALTVWLFKGQHSLCGCVKDSTHCVEEWLPQIMTFCTAVLCTPSRSPTCDHTHTRTLSLHTRLCCVRPATLPPVTIHTHAHWVCIHGCVVYAQPLAHLWPYTHTHTRTHARTHARTHTRTHARTHTHTHTYTRLHAQHGFYHFRHLKAIPAPKTALQQASHAII